MRKHLGMILIAAACAVIPCAAQSKPATDPAPCSVTPQPDPCGTTPAPPAKPTAAQKFPFPGEASSTSSSSDAPAPSLSGVPAAPDAPDAPAAADVNKKFPFPGANDEPGAGSAGSSSSSSSSSSDAPQYDPDANPANPGSPGLTDKGSEGTAPTPGRHILHRVNPIGTKLQSDDDRETEDLNVAHYYISTGDLKGAYLRSQDAVKTAPDDPDAHFLLAEMALKLNKKDEAIAEYNTCLKLDPVEKEAKDARKALEHLGVQTPK